MKKLRFVLILVAFFSLCSIASAQKPLKLDTFGYYYIKKPIKAFANISEIHLAGDYGKQEKPPMYGLIRLKDAPRDFKILKPVEKGDFISFSTDSVGGVSYRFSGNFTRLFIKNQKSTDKLNDGGIVLRGTLTKLKRGAKIAEQAVEFTYFTGT